MAVDVDRWQPDHQLVPAILAGSPTVMADLCLADRAWAVAGLHRAGHTAEQICDRLDCALRTVRTLLASPMVAVCTLLQEESENFADEYRMSHGEIARLTRELREVSASANRYREQLLGLIAVDPEAPATFPCGCPRTKYNTYIAPKTGKAGCRKHRTLAVERHRANARNARLIGEGVIRTAGG